MTDKKTNSREVVATRATRSAGAPGKAGWARPLLISAGFTAGAWLLGRTLPGRVALGALKFAPLLLPLLAAKVVEEADAADESGSANEASEAHEIDRTEPTLRRAAVSTTGRAAKKPAPRSARVSAESNSPGLG